MSRWKLELYLRLHNKKNISASQYSLKWKGKILMEIFVFGSNLAGRHGKGAALHAKEHYGAIYGQGEGLQGRSYGIPTKNEKIFSLPLPRIAEAVDRFKIFANQHQEYIFNVTPIGCGLAGFKPEQIAPMFKNSTKNVLLPNEFKQVLEQIAVRSTGIER